MKKFVATSILLFFLIGISHSQELTNWKHYYAPPYYNFETENYLEGAGAEELIQLDKSTFVVSRIPFPANVRALNSHLNNYIDTTNGWNSIHYCTSYLTQGPGQSLILKNGCTNYTSYQWDGISWQPFSSFLGYPLQNLKFFPNNGGSTFFTANPSSLSKWNGTTLTTYDSTNSPIHYNYLGNVFLAPNDDVFLTSYSKINVLHNGIWTSYDTTFFHLPYLSSQVASVSPSNDFVFYNRTDTAFHTFHSSTGIWDNVHLPSFICHATEPQMYMNLWNTTFDANGDMWISGDSVFCKFDGTQFYDYLSVLPSNFYGLGLGIKKLNTTNLLLINNQKSYVFNINSHIITPINDPQAVLLTNSMYTSMKDVNGTIWFGNDAYTEAILNYNGTFNTLPFQNGINGKIYPIKQDTGQTIVFAGELESMDLSGPMQYNGNTFSFLDSSNTYFNPIEALAIDKNHHYWFGGGIDGSLPSLSEFHNGVLSSYNNSFIGWSKVYSLDIDSLDNKWVGYTDTINMGVYKLTGSTFTRYYNGNSPLPDNRITNIVREGNSNKMWFCTRGGFARYWNGAWMILNTNNSPLPGNDAEYVYLADDQSLWFGTMEGIASLKDGVWSVYTAFNSPLDNNDIESIVVDNNCTVWMPTERGLTSAIYRNCAAQGIIIDGLVKKSNGAAAPNTNVNVYKLNAFGNDVTQIENLFTDNLGAFSYYTLDTGYYYFQAISGSSLFPNQITAYEDSSLVVQQAIPMHITASGVYSTNIKLRQINSQQVGLCVLNGKLYSSTERTGNVRLVLMFNGQPVKSVLSAVDGKFEFTDLAPGNYAVWVDKYGLNNTTAPIINVDCSNNNEYSMYLYSSNLTLYVPSLAKENTISIYPNPNKGVFMIESSNIKITSIKVVNILGELVYQSTNKQLNNLTIDLSNESKGIYFVQIIEENKTVVNKKIIIQ